MSIDPNNKARITSTGQMPAAPAAGRVTNCPEANELLARKYRSGWTLDG